MSGLLKTALRAASVPALLALLATGSSALAQAQSTQSQAASQATFTGDWSGARDRLEAGGVSVRGDYVSETFSAVDWGLRHGGGYTQQVRIGADFDMAKLAAWSGGIVHLTVNDRRGKGVSSDVVGNRLPIQEAYGGQYARLTEVSVEQRLDGGRLNLRAGFFAMGNDLGGQPIGCNLVNAAFCAHPLSLSGDSGWYNYPNARWGLAVRYALRPELLVRTGVYQANPALNAKSNAWRPFASGSTGMLLPLEVEYDAGVAGGGAMAGHYKAGVYYDSSRVSRPAETATVKGRYGVYLLADQKVWRDGVGARGLSLFGQYTVNPKSSAQITRWYAAGLVKTGVLRRAAEMIAVGLVHARINPRLQATYLSRNPLPGGYVWLPAGETVVEFSYGWQARRWLSVRPDLQYVIDPGAFSFRTTPNALALGAQVKATF